MKRKLKQLLSLLLVLLFVVSMLPTAFAEGETPETAIGEPEEPVTAEEPAGEPEPEKEIPYGFAGMPEGYALSKSAIDGKQAQWDNNVADVLESMTPGKDYVENEVLVTASTEEEAQIIAAAYNAELVRFDGLFALLRLRSNTVRQAVEVGMDPDLTLPPVDPNYIITVKPVEYTDETAPIGDEYNADYVPSKTDWNYWRSNDPLLLYPESDYYQYMHDMVKSYTAWGVTTGNWWPTVAVIDSGVDYNHEDLGYITKGWDYVDGDNDPMDEYGHGTHCAGIINAQLDNGVGGAGIAPGAFVMAVRVLDENGSGTTDRINSGIKYAADNGAAIINLSLGGPGYATTMQTAVNYANSKNVTVIAAMGNDGINIKNYPAALDGVIAVAAVNKSGERAPYSNYGKWCDIAAPGSDIWSTVPGNSYESMDGTSMAAPVVSGAAALYMSLKYSNPGPDKMLKILQSSVSSCKSKECGKGIIDASKLVSETSSVCFDVWTYEWEYDEEDDCWFITWQEKRGSSEDLNNAVISPDTALSLYANPFGDGRYSIVYTLDGSNPSVANGMIKNGINDDQVFMYSYKPGDTVTLKALCINGMSAVSKVQTFKFTVAPYPAGSGELSDITVQVTAPKALIPGKSVTLGAKVEGIADLDQKVTWKIVSNSGCPSAKIDAKTGKLTTKASETGTVTVRATSSVYPSKYKNVTIPVKQINPIGTIKLENAKMTVDVGQLASLSIGTLMDNKKNDVGITTRSYRWTSSNPSIAYVESYGDGWCDVVCRKKGSATITCEVLDGSGKKATCKLTVRQPAESIEITGQRYIASGTSATYKAKLLPKGNYEKALWSLDSAPAGVTIDPTKGVLKVPSDVKSGTITVVAQATPCGAAIDFFEVQIVSAKAASVEITSYSKFGSSAYPVVTKKNNKITEVTLYSVNTNQDSDEENNITLYASASNGAELVWTSSNPKVAMVDPNYGYVWAVSAGTATITCAAQDGSGKKATCKVKVINPVSSIFVKSKNPCFRQEDSVFLVGIGKTASNTVVFGDTYGVPTNKKVTWSFTAYQENWDESNYTNVTSTLKNNNWVKLSSSGALTVDKKIQSLWESTVESGRYLVIYVYATSQDGTHASGVARYVVTPLTKKLSTTVPGNTITLKVGNYNSPYYYIYNDVGGYYGDYTITSSNPDIASAIITEMYLDAYEIRFISGNKTGTAKITFKANDGSNKSVTITVKVIN